MANFEVQFDLKGTITIKADNYEKAEQLAKKKLEHYKESMKVHFNKEMHLNIDDVEEIS